MEPIFDVTSLYSEMKDEVIVITGQTGTGKSYLARTLLDAETAYIMDGAKGGIRFDPPAPAQITAVVIDHIFDIDDAVDVYSDALQWVREHGKRLFLVEQSLQDIENCGVKIPSDAIVIELYGSITEKVVSVKLNEDEYVTWS